MVGQSTTYMIADSEFVSKNLNSSNINVKLGIFICLKFHHATNTGFVEVKCCMRITHSREVVFITPLCLNTALRITCAHDMRTRPNLSPHDVSEKGKQSSLVGYCHSLTKLLVLAHLVYVIYYDDTLGYPELKYYN